MKVKLILLVMMLTSMPELQAQNPLSLNTQLEIGLGYLRPHYRKGVELIRSYELRKNGLSYYADNSGTRRSVGNYSASNGYNMTIGFYKPVTVIKGLMLGVLVRNAQTGSTPENGGYEEAYFFNFITAGVAAKYYPFEKNNVFLKADVGLAAVLTKNRYLTDNNEQNFFHQFGIGSALGLEVGYALPVSKQKKITLELKSGYQLASTRVEVNGIGDDQWKFGAVYVGSTLIF